MCSFYSRHCCCYGDLLKALFVVEVAASCMVFLWLLVLFVSFELVAVTCWLCVSFCTLLILLSFWDRPSPVCSFWFVNHHNQWNAPFFYPSVLFVCLLWGDQTRRRTDRTLMWIYFPTLTDGIKEEMFTITHSLMLLFLLLFISLFSRPCCLYFPFLYLVFTVSFAFFYPLFLSVFLIRFLIGTFTFSSF